MAENNSQQLIAKPQAQGPMQKFKAQLYGANVQEYITDVVADKKDRETFLTSLISVVANDATLQKCNPMSVFHAALQSVPLKLPIEKNMGYSAVIAYGANAQFQIMRNGWMELAMRTGKVKHIANEPVYEGELVKCNRFTDTYEFDESKKSSNKIVGYMAYIELVNGFEKTIYWSDEKVKAHALKYSQAYKKGYGPWKDNFEAMALKTVLKHLLVKYCPKSTEMDTALKHAFMQDQKVFTAVNPEGVYADNGNAPDEQPAAEYQEGPAAIAPVDKAEEVKAQVEALKARRKGATMQVETPATPEEAIPAPTIEDMPADTETGEIFNEQQS